MKDYSKMSDFEINKWIAIELAPNGYIGINESTRYDSEVVVTTENGEGCTKNSYVDYCNNPSDAWSVMEENKIGIAFVNGEWRASSVKAGYHEFSDKRAFKAAMIVYLMMKDEEK